ncbi:PorT protein [Flavilitoribacter nigricans DSM 23189 = NBRC 102662]|uniref:PorT protein n=1 Tax=Flavilitoribacter nigricans (strain ATCC 23147 / DSM 23189 / NBRC 102662 / NCIMB 1420 / SS-2) TaxID=1122177 RepID=A0A2D0N9Q8_FLAN2|nr:PorT protein [Flavilitoribacter nigricans DSM 23189 = NBRC 102662]
MHTFNARSLFHLSWRKISLCLLLAIGLSASLQGQRRDLGNYNFYDFQQKSYYFGITLAINRASFQPFRSRDFIYSDSIQSVESIEGPGFNLGIVTNLKIGQYFDFRFLPTLSFAERNLRYDRESRVRDFTQRKVTSVLVEMPFHFRYKSEPYKDKRLFVIAGIKYNFDVASDSRTRQAETLVKISPHDFAIEYGAGIQFFFPYFIFSPEFKVSHGIGNTLIFNPNLEESTVLEKILSRTFTISFHFEG